MPVGLSDGTFHEDYTLMMADTASKPTEGLRKVYITGKSEVEDRRDETTLTVDLPSRFEQQFGISPEEFFFGYPRGSYTSNKLAKDAGYNDIKPVDAIEALDFINNVEKFNDIWKGGVAPTSGDLPIRREISLPPAPAPETGVPFASRMPPQASTEPAGALKSEGGSQTPGNSGKAENEVDWSRLNQPTGEVKMIDVGDSPLRRQLDDFKRRAAEPVKPLNEITDEEIKQAINVGLGAGPGIIAGVKGLTTLPAYAKGDMLTKLGHAQVLEGQAAHADDVWQQTGFFRGADGRWKYEIPDEQAVLKESGFHKNIIPNDPRVGGEENITYSLKRAGFAKVEDIIEHSRLFEAYPFLKNIQVVEHKNPNTVGSADIRNKTISFRDDLDPEYLRGVLLHELQHFVQAHEGFAGGANSQAFKHSKFDELLAQYEKAVSEGADPNSAQMKETRKVINDAWDIALEKYRRVMGEVEARNVQTRRDFNAVKRHYNSPASTEDRPRFIQINPQ